MLSVVYPSCAGIDVAKDIQVVILPADAKGEQEVKSFGGFTKYLQALAEWLKCHDIEPVALESTGVYWISLFEVLDAHGFGALLDQLSAHTVRHQHALLHRCLDRHKTHIWTTHRFNYHTGIGRIVLVGLDQWLDKLGRNYLHLITQRTQPSPHW